VHTSAHTGHGVLEPCRGEMITVPAALLKIADDQFSARIGVGFKPTISTAASICNAITPPYAPISCPRIFDEEPEFALPH